MIEISARVKSLPGYPLAEIPSIKRRLLESGLDVIDLGERVARQRLHASADLDH